MKEQILAAIQQFETIIIHRHVRPDPDAYGSQCGLGTMLQQSFPEKTIHMVGADEESLTFLRFMDQIDDSVYDEALVIVCDTANQARVCDQRFNKGKMLIKIDHHPNEDPYGDIVWVDTTASSCSEMIYEFYQYGQDKGLVLTEDSARFIFAGIVGDTGRFLFPSTSPKTFQYAAELVKHGIAFPQLYDEMYKTSVKLARLNGYILQNFELTEEGASYIKITRDTLQEFGVRTNEASSVVGALGNIEGIKAWVLFLEEEDCIRVRLRSKGPVINRLAMKYNGGGHPMASGATIYSWDEAEQVIADLRELCLQA
ncbi:DHH family phosphoesterase [Ectobacillus ponti]|uniref:Bifunctional oligoribonuclease/PAP phosphatase NrnA n=1 Tax=Ectobacillus ponti TaxID=2961894 RepID=A0AA41X8P4_9BACI|nr:bifunctional oligoribonuclease/PAP phosphatase NrnA [Ectobacillus ponti]MCP8967441.1 bifunctional oligoribonuclease/PAP phosphatase NrnA [Ectobacillus ponti]